MPQVTIEITPTEITAIKLVSELANSKKSAISLYMEAIANKELSSSIGSLFEKIEQGVKNA